MEMNKQLPDGPIFESDLLPVDPPPTWDVLRRAGQMLVDDRFRRLAVYAGGAGAVVLMSQCDCDKTPQFIPMDYDFVPKLIAALSVAQAEAAAVWAAIEVEMGKAQAAQGPCEAG